MGPYTLHNPILQLCSILTIIFSLMMLVVTFVPAAADDLNDSDKLYIRVVFTVALLGSIQGIV